jgi:hypothetical protein
MMMLFVLSFSKNIKGLEYKGFHTIDLSIDGNPVL